MPEHFSVYYDDMNVNTDFSIFGVRLNIKEYQTMPYENLNNISKKDEKEILNNNKYPIIIINPIFEHNTHLIDHVSIGVRNKE